jgi:hypothetical protein
MHSVVPVASPARTSSTISSTVKPSLTLKRASTSHPSGEWSDDYYVHADGLVVRRIMKPGSVPVGQSWMWTLAFRYHEDRTPAHG